MRMGMEADRSVDRSVCRYAHIAMPLCAWTWRLIHIDWIDSYQIDSYRLDAYRLQLDGMTCEKA